MTLQFRGSNLSGGDAPYVDKSGKATWSVATGPVSGTHYLFVTTKDIDYLLSKGANCFRLLFTWEALQPTRYASIGAQTGNFKAYWDSYKALVDYITSKGASVIVDCHGGLDADFAAYFGAKIGTKTPGGDNVADLFENLWYQLAGIFKTNSRVIFGITNEPHDMPAATWFACAQTVINSIRKQGATNLIVMPGVDWTNAGSWTNNSGPGWDAAQIADPAKNIAIQVHMYFDANAGGGATDIVNADIGVTRLKVSVDWARARGLKVFLAEVGLAASNSLATTAWQRLAAYMDANADTVIGFTFWSYGPPAWWGGYQFTLCPKGTTDSPQMSLIASSLAAPATPPAPDPIADLKAQIASLAAQLASAQTTNASAQAANANLTTQLASAQSALNASAAALSRTAGERDAALAENATMHAGIAALRTTLAGLP